MDSRHSSTWFFLTIWLGWILLNLCLRSLAIFWDLNKAFSKQEHLEDFTLNKETFHHLASTLDFCTIMVAITFGKHLSPCLMPKFKLIITNSNKITFDIFFKEFCMVLTYAWKKLGGLKCFFSKDNSYRGILYSLLLLVNSMTIKMSLYNKKSCLLFSHTFIKDVLRMDWLWEIVQRFQLPQLLTQTQAHLFKDNILLVMFYNFKSPNTSLQRIKRGSSKEEWRDT